jgi:hypothetical protein
VGGRNAIQTLFAPLARDLVSAAHEAARKVFDFGARVVGSRIIHVRPFSS